MFQKLLLALTTLCCLSSCITFNTGAKLDSIGKAVPTTPYHEGQFYKLNGAGYKEIMVEYRQLNPKLVGICCGHNIDTCNPATPAPDSIGAPGAELYLARLDTKRTDMPDFIRAIDFDYTRAESVKKEDLPVCYMAKDAFKYADLVTLTPTMYESSERVLNDLPTIRTTGNKLRLPLAVALSYGVDLPLTAASYTVGSILYPILRIFGL